MSCINADENAKSRQLESHLNQKRTRRRVDRTAAMVRIGAPLWSSGHDIAKFTSFKIRLRILPPIDSAYWIALRRKKENEGRPGKTEREIINRVVTRPGLL